MITEKEVKEIIEAKFGKYLQPLSQISKDPANDEIMIDRSTMFHNYDKIAEEAYNIGDDKDHDENSNADRNDEKKPKTPDMILFKNNTILFVEFKNGKIKEKTKWDMKLKAIEGGFIVLYKIIVKYGRKDKAEIDFLDIVKLRKHYIVVYNEGNHKKKGEKTSDYHQSVKKNICRFGLLKYRKTFFDEVETYTCPVFEDWLKKQQFMECGLG